MNAIKKNLWLVLAACLFVMGSIRMMADEKNNDAPSVPIPLTAGDVIKGGDARGGIVPFSAYYQGGTIYVSTSAEFSVISVAVVNETTSQSWSSTTDISDGMGEISITNAGIGSYRVEIITEYGECFVGSFCL